MFCFESTLKSDELLELDEYGGLKNNTPYLIDHFG